VLAGNAEERSDLGLAPAGRLDHFTQQFTGMGWAPVRIALSGIFGHGFASSMVLLEIHAQGISRVEFERDAPWPVDVDRVPGRNETFQGVKIKPWKVHLLRCGRGIQPIETDQDPSVHLRADFRGAALRPQFGQRLVSKRPNHGRM
jgi:hypothetical protein